MLRTNGRITLTGESIINDEVVCVYSGSIDMSNPEKMTVGQVQKDKDAYKDNRNECRADYAAFEDMVLAEQEKLLATVAPVEPAAE
jgi:hypothetical protein